MLCAGTSGHKVIYNLKSQLITLYIIINEDLKCSLHQTCTLSE